MNWNNIERNWEFGKDIFESIPEIKRPSWALSLLHIFNEDIIFVPKDIQQLYLIIENPNIWNESYEQFYAIRKFNIANPTFSPNSYLVLAENIAKVTYNCTNPSAPFDKISGWNLIHYAKITVDYYDTGTLKKALLEIIEKTPNRPRFRP